MKVLSFVLFCLLSCTSQSSKKDETNTKQLPKTTPSSNTTILPDTPPLPVSNEPWPERPREILVEARIEGIQPTITAGLTQARQIGQVPPLEMMLPSMLGSFLNLNDPSVIDLLRPAGFFLIDMPEKESTASLIYLGIQSETSFRNALPEQAKTTNSKGNAIAFPTSSSSPLEGELIYLNFIGSYVIGTSSSDSFAIVKPYLETLLTRKLQHPSLWVSFTVDALRKKFAKEIEENIKEMVQENQKQQNTANAQAGLESILKLLEEVDTLTILHNPAKEFYTLSVLVKALPDAPWKERLAKPVTRKTDLLAMLPFGWLGGVNYSEPETLKALQDWSENVVSWSNADFMGGLFHVYQTASTGETAFSGTENGFIFVSGISDQEAVKKAYRKTFSSPKRVSADTIAVEYKAIETDVEEIGGVLFDRISVSYDTSDTTKKQAEVFKLLGLDSFHTYLAYLPDKLIVALGDNTKSDLEAILSGKPGTLVQSKEVNRLLEKLPEQYIGAFFLSLPMAAKLFGGMQEVIPFSLPSTKNGMLVGWYQEEDHLQIDLILSIEHILEIKTILAKAQAKTGS